MKHNDTCKDMRYCLNSKRNKGEKMLRREDGVHSVIPKGHQ